LKTGHTGTRPDRRSSLRGDPGARKTVENRLQKQRKKKSAKKRKKGEVTTHIEAILA
jgi:hypothetical protein